MSAASLALLATVNLWKTSGLALLIHADPTFVSIIWVVLATLLAWLRTSFRIPPVVPWAVAAYALMLPALAVTSFDNPYSVEKSQALLLVLPLSLLAPSILLSDARNRGAFIMFTCGLGVLAGIALLGWGQAGPTGRVSVGDANPISMGRMAAIGAVGGGLLALRFRGRLRYVALAVTLVSAIASMSTGSRGPIAAAALAVVVVSLVTGTLRVLPGLVFIFLSGAVAVNEFVPSAALQRIVSGSSGGSESSDFRWTLIQNAISVAWDNWQGVGWGDLGYHLAPTAIIYEQGWRQYPHNIVAEVAAEGGVLAVVGLGVLLAISFRRLRANVVDVQGRISLGLWVLALAVSMTSSDIIGNRFLWVMIGVGLASPMPAKRRGGSASSLSIRIR